VRARVCVCVCVCVCVREQAGLLLMPLCCWLSPPGIARQCVAGAMYITGFAESISDLLGLGDIWAVRGISVAVLLALLGINLAGVKWIIRLQLLLLLLLAVSTLDFVVGSFTHLDPGKPLECSAL
jgi:hypothetical protein